VDGGAQSTGGTSGCIDCETGGAWVTGTGGAATVDGGAPATGGNFATGGNWVTTDGGAYTTVATGGNAATGGSKAATGGKATGGKSSTSAATGGKSATGGKAATGGYLSVDGGWPATGGAMPIGTGGAYPATGGAYPATGGWEGSTGGAWEMGSGGAWGTGGAPSLARVCTPGADQTCNDSPLMSALAGHCESDQTCTCTSPYVTNPHTYKCNTYDQTLCYSPTQEIDKAYVDRAVGCICDSTFKPAFCALDSQGLLVYLACTDSKWKSGDTNNCTTDAKACVSPTQNLDYAHVSGAVGCACDAAVSSEECGTSSSGNIVRLVCVSGKWLYQPGSCTIP
jgi:hypothetical protein